MNDRRRDFGPMGIRTKSIREVPISNKGIYVWVMPDGRPIMDDDYNVLNVECEKGDISAIAKLQEAALYWKGPDARDGTYKFIAGTYRVSDEELWDQLEAMERGEL